MIFSLDEQLEPQQEYPVSVWEQAEEAVQRYGQVFAINQEEKDTLRNIIAAAIYDHMSLEDYDDFEGQD